MLGGAMLQGQRYSHIYDGPYISDRGHDIEIKWVAKGKKKSKVIPKEEATLFQHKKLPQVDLTDLSVKPDSLQFFDDVQKYVAISDVHGQYDLCVQLLQQHHVIDSSLQWSYGAGHLIIVGDMLDRGDKVTELLWFLFFLEKQAEHAGGKVHVLLGNHELMVLHENVQYISPKYRYVTGALTMAYPDLYGDDTVLGGWLRSKNIVAVINGTAFVHGGFSKEVIEKESSLHKINSLFKEKIYKNKKIQSNSSLVSKLYFDNGPLWYRGYANPAGFDVEQADYILDEMGVDRLVVGHTSMPRIVSLHDHKIILIDSSIKFGRTGEVLISEGDSLYRGQMNGQRISLSQKERSRSPFEYVYDLGDGDLTIVLEMDVKKLLKTKMEENFQKAKLLAYHNSEFNREWNVQVRTRGNMRKQLCHLPPIKIDFSKSTLAHLGFSRNDKLKVVLPCDDNEEYQQGLYREYVTYKLYELIDSMSLRTRLSNFVLKQGRKVKYELTGFVVEDEENYTLRTDTYLATDSIMRAEYLQRESYLKMVFFQYMIRNKDWGIFNKHNVEIVRCDKGMIAIPYDFDYAGIVGQDYVEFSKEISDVEITLDFFRGKDVTLNEVEEISIFYMSAMDDFYSVVQNSSYLNESSKTHMIYYLDYFYRQIEDRENWSSYFKIID